MSQIVLEKPAPGVALLRLNRPEALNALDMAIREELALRVPRQRQWHRFEVVN